MTRERFVIIGADAAGMSAASEARRADPVLEIVAYDRGGFVSYSQCGLERDGHRAARHGNR